MTEAGLSGGRPYNPAMDFHLDQRSGLPVYLQIVQQVREALAGNLCRCGSHARVIRAVLRAAAQGGR